MKTQTTAPKIKVSATSLQDASQFDNASAWVLLLDGRNAGKVLWTWSKSGTVKCSIILHSFAFEKFGFTGEQPDELFSPMVIGSAAGGGYDKRSAAFDSCLRANGYTGPYAGGVGADNYLIEMGFTVVWVM